MSPKRVLKHRPPARFKNELPVNPTYRERKHDPPLDLTMNRTIFLSSILAAIAALLPLANGCTPATSPYGASVSSTGWTGRSQHVLSQMEVCFPGTFSCGGSTRPGSPKSDHSRGNALDCFPGPSGVMHFGVDKAEGDQLAAWLVDNARRLRIYYVIWYRHIWTFTKSTEGWRDCKFTTSCIGEGGNTITHLDHIHISVYGSDRTNPDYTTTTEPGAGLGSPPELGCVASSGSGTCVTTATCAARGKTSVPLLCPGPADFQCCV